MFLADGLLIAAHSGSSLQFCLLYSDYFTGRQNGSGKCAVFKLGRTLTDLIKVS